MTSPSLPLARLAEQHTDNLPPPCVGGSPRAISRSTYDAILNIRRALYKFGIVTSFRAYVGSMPLQTKWELQSHGVTVIECLWNVSETMITGGLVPDHTLCAIDLNRTSADMFRFALDNPSLGSTLVLISSSFTLAYTISVLGARRYRVALISAADPHNTVLLAQASEVIDWHSLLLRSNTNHPRRSPSPPAMQNSSTTSTPEDPTGLEYNLHVGPTFFPHNMAETLEVRGVIFNKSSCVKCTFSIPSPSTILTSQETAGKSQLHRPPIPTACS